MKTKTDTTYNGWTNYATWRVHLEIFDGLPSDIDGEKVTAQECQDYAEQVVLDGVKADTFAGSCALEFLEDVNWQEIAEHLNES